MMLDEALRSQGRGCAALGSPFMGRLMPLLADHWPKGGVMDAICAGFDGDLGSSGHSLPLRMAGGLHALVLTGQDAALATVYPPAQPSDDALIGEVLTAFERHADFFRTWMTSPPQTNEVRRSVALIPAAHWIAARHDLPFVTSELGASGGLNLSFDRFALETDAGRLGPDDPALTLRPDWSGPLPAQSGLQVADRRGVDLNPLDPANADDRLRLLAYLWPDQPERKALTEAAMQARDGAVDRGDAIDWLEQRLPPRPGHLHLIYHTIAWQYFPAAVQSRGTAMIEAAGARAREDCPLAWLRMEADDQDRGAGLSLRLWPGDHSIDLARVDFHGRWTDWCAT